MDFMETSPLDKFNWNDMLSDNYKGPCIRCGVDSSGFTHLVATGERKYGPLCSMGCAMLMAGQNTYSDRAKRYLISKKIEMFKSTESEEETTQILDQINYSKYILDNEQRFKLHNYAIDKINNNIWKDPHKVIYGQIVSR